MRTDNFVARNSWAKQVTAVCLVLTATLFAPGASQAAEPDSSSMAGRDLFLNFQCWQCHGYQAQGGAAPRLANKSYSYEAFVRFVRHPSVMPAYPPNALSDEKLRRIYDFVTSIPEPPALDSIPALRE